MIGAGITVLGAALAFPGEFSFRMQVLKVDGAVQRILAEDLDGDGRKDLLVFSVSGEKRGQRERRVAWFSLGPQGFAITPDRSWSFDPEGSVLDLGRSREGWFDLFYSVPEGLRRYRLVPEKRGPPAAEPFYQGVNLLSGRSEEAFFFFDFARDWMGQGAETPAVLQPGRLLILKEDAGSAPVELRLGTDVELFDLGAPLEFRPILPLVINQSYPALYLEDWNGDGRADLLAALGERVEVHLAGRKPAFSVEPDFKARLLIAAPAGEPDPRPGVQLEDLNGDGRIDALVSTLSGGFSNLRNNTQLFLGTASGFETNPRASLEAKGALAQVVVLDLDGDGRKELILASVSTGVAALLKMLLTRRARVQFSAYRLDRLGSLSGRPELEWSLPLKLDFSGPTDLPIFTPSGDFDGDGIRDLVSSPDEGEILIRRLERGRSGLRLGRVVARLRAPSVGQAMAVDLFGRGRSDLLLYQPRSREGRGEVRIFLNGT